MVEDWLREVKEVQAADWWREYWCEEHGNYTNATAGYVGNNKSTGCESHWKYIKRDTIGNAGSNKRISVRVFVPSLTQYISDLSKRHADKILDPKTGAHRFPMLPTISTSMWCKVQKFDLMRLLLSVSVGSKDTRKKWEDELEWFHEVETDGKVFTDIVQMYREAGNRMHVARSTLEALIMPTDKGIRQLKYHYQGQSPKFEEFAAEMQNLANAYRCMIDTADQFEVEFPQYTLKDTLDLMESFNYIRPLAIKSGDQVFLCTCCDAYQKYCCAESTALSLLFNHDLDCATEADQGEGEENSCQSIQFQAHQGKGEEGRGGEEEG